MVPSDTRGTHSWQAFLHPRDPTLLPWGPPQEPNPRAAPLAHYSMDLYLEFHTTNSEKFENQQTSHR